MKTNINIFDCKMMKRIAIFASGRGSNALKIIEHFQEHNQIEVSLIVSNKNKALVLNVADRFNIAKLVINRDDFYRSDATLEYLKSHNIDFVILAGFLWLVPLDMINYFNKRMLNIHPALLPKYGGKGMYGMNVHRAVKDAGEQETGITIHYVDPEYDEGQIVFQAKCQVNENDTPESIAQKIHELEHRHYPTVIEHTIRSTFGI